MRAKGREAVEEDGAPFREGRTQRSQTEGGGDKENSDRGRGGGRGDNSGEVETGQQRGQKPMSWDGERNKKGWGNIGGRGPPVGNGGRHKEVRGGRGTNGVRNMGGVPPRYKTWKKDEGQKTAPHMRGGGMRLQGGRGCGRRWETGSVGKGGTWTAAWPM